MTGSDGRDRRAPPGPVKIHRFEKPPARAQEAAGREREDSVHSHPTLPELSLAPRGAEAPTPAPRAKPQALRSESASPKRASSSSREPRGAAKASGAPADGARAEGLAAGLLSERLATARQLFSEGQFTPARAILEKLTALGVGGAAVQTLLGTIYLAQGAGERALACFEQVLQADPSDLSARFHRGEARLSLGDLLLAREDLDYVLESGTAGSPLVRQALRLLQRLDALKDSKRP